MSSNDELRKFLEARNRAFETDDYSWARSRLGDSAPESSVLNAFHKARYTCLAVSEAKRRESQEWLAKHNSNDINGEPVKAGDPLPG